MARKKVGAQDVLASFSEPTRAWFEAAFAAPTPAQVGAWQAIAAGRNALVVAPTGSGKTLSAFLWSIDRLAASPPPEEKLHRCRVLYVSPLKALAVDVERNLRAPLAGIRHTAARLGTTVPDITVGLRSGDTPAADTADATRAAHPVAGCPRLGIHLKAAAAVEKLTKDTDRLRRRVQSRSESLARQFDRVLRVLESWAYVDGWRLTDGGV